MSEKTQSRNRLILVLILILVASLVVVSVVSAAPAYQDEVPGELPFTDFISFLLWLAEVDGGAFIVVTIFVSLVLEKWAVWQRQSAQRKTWLIGLLAVGLSSFAGWLVGQDQIVEAIAPYANWAIAFMGSWLLFIGTHAVNKTFTLTAPRR
jgi:hypothetical protein